MLANIVIIVSDKAFSPLNMRRFLCFGIVLTRVSSKSRRKGLKLLYLANTCKCSLPDNAGLYSKDVSLMQCMDLKTRLHFHNANTFTYCFFAFSLSNVNVALSLKLLFTVAAAFRLKTSAVCGWRLIAKRRFYGTHSWRLGKSTKERYSKSLSKRYWNSTNLYFLT